MLKRTVRNTDATHNSVPHNTAGAALFQSMAAKAAGQIVERTTDYQRLQVRAEYIRLAADKRRDVAGLCFGQSQDNAPYAGPMLGGAIAANASRTVLSKPVMGILSWHAAYPVRAAPVQLIFALSDSEHVFQEPITTTDQSHSYVVEAPQMLCNTMEVESHLLASDRNHTLSGGELTFELSSWGNINSAVTSPRVALALNRRLHMCHGLYATFMSAAAVNTRMTNRYCASTGDDVSIYSQVGIIKLGHPFQGMAELLYRFHDGGWCPELC